MTAKRLEALATELRDINMDDGCVPEEVEIDGKSVEVTLSDNPLCPLLMFEVMSSIAKAHPEDVAMKVDEEADVYTITAQF